MSQTFQTLSCITNTLNHKTELFSKILQNLPIFHLPGSSSKFSVGHSNETNRVREARRENRLMNGRSFLYFSLSNWENHSVEKPRSESISFCWMATAGSTLRNNHWRGEYRLNLGMCWKGINALLEKQMAPHFVPPVLTDWVLFHLFWRSLLGTNIRFNQF